MAKRRISVDPRNPRAAAICDVGGELRFRDELKREMRWAGNKLVWTGRLVCGHHLDKPQPQDRRPILKPDPVPVKFPRAPAKGYTATAVALAGGSGYAPGEVLTFGDPSAISGSAAKVQILTVANGVPVTWRVINGGLYSAQLAAGAIQTATTGHGTGAAATFTWLAA